MDKDETKAALQAYFLSTSLYTLPLLKLSGLLTVKHLYYDACGFPAALLGIGVGTVVYNTFDAQQFARLVVIALGLAGVIYVLTAGTELLHN